MYMRNVKTGKVMMSGIINDVWYLHSRFTHVKDFWEIVNGDSYALNDSKYKLICVDNYDRDDMPSRLIAEHCDFTKEEWKIFDELVNSDYSPDYYTIVEV